MAWYGIGMANHVSLATTTGDLWRIDRLGTSTIAPAPMRVRGTEVLLVYAQTQRREIGRDTWRSGRKDVAYRSRRGLKESRAIGAHRRLKSFFARPVQTYRPSRHSSDSSIRKRYRQTTTMPCSPA